ncbi:hypothetical protein D8674_003608 [Pyrus ussuriensis x Pyrus communis]|uniref:Uncharacterized protein n=1 Tax=Pyrus ussuriensis x Pyrus communis TaxID=2448454 RepID=A0A5N5FI95_9ROSA|nr:hypothetical protein D8674_003608 [Pyrus ussuriensis x Pyrus communis]
MAFHTRSNSFPSRPHLIAQEVDVLLCRLRSSEATSVRRSAQVVLVNPSIGRRTAGQAVQTAQQAFADS